MDRLKHLLSCILKSQSDDLQSSMDRLKLDFVFAFSSSIAYLQSSMDRLKLDENSVNAIIYSIFTIQYG